MALQAGRVGVNKNQVDWQGNIIGGDGSSVQPQIDQIKSQIGSFEFSVVDGKAGYKTSSTGEFAPFSSGADIENLNFISVSAPTNHTNLAVNIGDKILFILGGTQYNDFSNYPIYNNNIDITLLHSSKNNAGSCGLFIGTATNTNIEFWFAGEIGVMYSLL